MTDSIVPQKRNLQVSYSEKYNGDVVIDRNTGEAFVSWRGLGTLIDKDSSFARRDAIASLGTATNFTFETAEIPTAKGIRSATLVPEFVILKSIAKHKPDLLQACAGAGLRVFLHRLAGFEVTSTSMAPVKSDRELMLEAQLVAANARLETEEAKHELTEVKLLLEQKETYILRSVKDKPGLETLMESSQEFSQLLLPDQETQDNWTIWEWMTVYAKKRFVLEDTDFRKMVSRVHGAYKAVYNKPPRKDYRNQVNNPKANKLVQVYLPEEFGILEICYRDTIAEVCHN